MKLITDTNTASNTNAEKSNNLSNQIAVVFFLYFFALSFWQHILVIYNSTVKNENLCNLCSQFEKCKCKKVWNDYKKQCTVVETAGGSWRFFGQILFRGNLGVVRKFRWVVYSVFYCIFKTKFFEKNKGVHEEPPLPSPMCIYAIKL